MFLVRFVALASASAMGLAACTSEIVSASATAASGYATATSQLVGNPGEQVTVTAPLQRGVDGKISQTTETLVMTGTSNPDELRVNYRGTDILLTRDPNHPEQFTATTADGLEVTIWFGGSFGTNANLAYVWASIFDSRTAAQAAEWGSFPTGFNTDPVQVAARSGGATYSGYGDLSIMREDGSYTYAIGDAMLTANFDAATVDGGVYNLVESGASDPGYEMTGTTNVVFDQAQINENTFSSQATVAAAPFGLARDVTVGVDGMFFDADASAVGGTMVGRGNDAVDGQTVFVNGSFAAEE